MLYPLGHVVLDISGGSSGMHQQFKSWIGWRSKLCLLLIKFTGKCWEKEVLYSAVLPLIKLGQRWDASAVQILTQLEYDQLPYIFPSLSFNLSEMRSANRCTAPRGTWCEPRGALAPLLLELGCIAQPVSLTLYTLAMLWLHVALDPFPRARFSLAFYSDQESCSDFIQWTWHGSQRERERATCRWCRPRRSGYMFVVDIACNLLLLLNIGRGRVLYYKHWERKGAVSIGPCGPWQIWWQWWDVSAVTNPDLVGEVFMKKLGEERCCDTNWIGKLVNIN